MKHLSIYVWLLAILTACVREETFSDNARGNFESLWKQVDEHYCFFDYKKEAYGLDWNEVHARYAKQVDESMTNSQLFEVLTHMLAELKDGHVNIYSPFDVARNWSYHENYPSNQSDTLIRKYLGTDYHIAGSLRYRILDDNIGYIQCPNFANGIGAGNLDHALLHLAPCNGLIIDVRGNGGGMLTAAEMLASRFTNKNLLVGYMQHKRGPGHSDFSPMQEQRLKPGRGIRWQKAVVVLTNRKVFSAANEFVKYMKCCPQVQTVGDRTGGGAGLPFSGELPNGWSIRFSACPTYDRDRRHTEFGIAPDHYVALADKDLKDGKDTLIEYARKLLHE